MMTDEYYMDLAFQEAKKAYAKAEIPVGCVIVVDDKIIARAHNLRHNKKNSLYHAEIIAINKACKKLNRWILDDATIYVTLEPCLMCGGAIIQSRIKRLVYGIEDQKFGCVESAIRAFDDYKSNHNVLISSGIYQEKISLLMKNYFKDLRENKKK